MISPELANAPSLTKLTKPKLTFAPNCVAAFLDVLRYQERGGKRHVVTKGRVQDVEKFPMKRLGQN